MNVVQAGMGGLTAEVGLGLIERFGGDAGKMLAAILGGGLGASSYRYFQPHSIGRGFDYSKKSARQTGKNVGRNISVGYNIDEPKGMASDIQTTNQFYQKYRRFGRNSRYAKRNCTCSSKRSKRYSARRFSRY